jgi:hypothetical protein
MDVTAIGLFLGSKQGTAKEAFEETNVLLV